MWSDEDAVEKLRGWTKEILSNDRDNGGAKIENGILHEAACKILVEESGDLMVKTEAGVAETTQAWTIIKGYLISSYCL